MCCGLEGGGEWGKAEGTTFFQIFRNMLAFYSSAYFNSIISIYLHIHIQALFLVNSTLDRVVIFYMRENKNFITFWQI